MTVSTVSILRQIGFSLDTSIPADFIGGGLRYDFTHLELEACACTSLRDGPVVLFTGVAANSRTIAEVMFEMPRAVESFEQGVAWLTWALDNQAGRVIVPGPAEDWMNIGRGHFSLLPWERRKAAYAARPSCSVDGQWIRIALKKLKESLELLPDSALVHFHHDGEILRIRGEEFTVIVAAHGEAWNQPAIVEAKSLRRLPKRLPAFGNIGIGVWEGRLTLHNYAYPTVQVDFGRTDAGELTARDQV